MNKYEWRKCDDEFHWASSIYIWTGRCECGKYHLDELE